MCCKTEKYKAIFSQGYSLYFIVLEFKVFELGLDLVLRLVFLVYLDFQFLGLGLFK